MKKWQIKFYAYSAVLRLMQSKYTGWVFSNKFKLKFAIESIGVIAETMQHKLKP